MLLQQLCGTNPPKTVILTALGSQQFSSVQDGIYALGKVRMCSTLSLGTFPNVAFETVPMFV